MVKRKWSISLLCCHHCLIFISPTFNMSCGLTHLIQRDGPSLLTTTSDSSFSSMSPSDHNLSLVCRSPRSQVADGTTVYMTEAEASVNRWGKDCYSLLVLLLECPHQVVDQYGWPRCYWAHWKLVLKLHLLRSCISLPLEQLESQAGPMICWRMKHHQNVSPLFSFWLRWSVSLVCLTTVHLKLSWFGILPVLGFVYQTQWCTL